MAKKIALTIDDRLFEKIQKSARLNDESVQDFFIRAVCDAVDMWGDFYTSETSSLDRKDSADKLGFFINS